MGGGQEQVKHEQAAVEVSLRSDRVAVGEVLAAQVDFHSLDAALDAGALGVQCLVPSEVLGVVPVDLREVVAMHADVTAECLVS